jgi:hypothetical protein
MRARRLVRHAIVSHLPSLAERAVEDYLRALDQAAPGVVEALYLIGSVALDDFQPGVSDIDFLAVTSRPLGASDLVALRHVHARAFRGRRRPFFDGTYITWADLGADPTLVVPEAHIHEGQWQPPATGMCNPVTWHELAWYGVVVRGPHRNEIRVRTDSVQLVSWTRSNMADYWRPWHERARRPLSKLGIAGLGGWAPSWGVLGVARQRFTVATGGIASKSAAGLYGREVYPARWHRIIDECLRIRCGSREPSRYANPFLRRRDALQFMDLVIAEVLRPSA